MMRKCIGKQYHNNQDLESTQLLKAQNKIMKLYKYKKFIFSSKKSVNLKMFTYFTNVNTLAKVKVIPPPFYKYEHKHVMFVGAVLQVDLFCVMCL